MHDKTWRWGADFSPPPPPQSQHLLSTIMLRGVSLCMRPARGALPNQSSHAPPPPWSKFLPSHPRTVICGVCLAGYHGLRTTECATPATRKWYPETSACRSSGNAGTRGRPKWLMRYSIVFCSYIVRVFMKKIYNFNDYCIKQTAQKLILKTCIVFELKKSKCFCHVFEMGTG